MPQKRKGSGAGDNCHPPRSTNKTNHNAEGETPAPRIAPRTHSCQHLSHSYQTSVSYDTRRRPMPYNVTPAANDTSSMRAMVAPKLLQ